MPNCLKEEVFSQPNNVNHVVFFYKNILKFSHSMVKEKLKCTRAPPCGGQICNLNEIERCTKTITFVTAYIKHVNYPVSRF